MLTPKIIGENQVVSNVTVTETFPSQETDVAINESGLVATNKPFLLEATTNFTPQAEQIPKRKIEEKADNQRGLYYQFAWIIFFPIVLMSSLYLKLKNRHLANEDHYLEHQNEFFSFFKSILEKVGYANLI